MTTLSSATAAAKAAQAELTAPVAANNAVAGNGGKGTATSGKSNADNKSDKGAAPAPVQPQAKPAPASSNPQANAGRQAAPAANQPDARSNGADAAAQAAAQAAAAAEAAPVVAPLFSQLLNLADVAATGDSGTDTGAKSDADDVTGSGSAAAGSVLPAMVTSLLNLPTPAPAAPVADTGAEAANVEAISATATLNTSATRLNLSAAGVAVAPAAQAADDAAAVAAAAAQASAAPAAAAQSVYTQANNSTLAAVAARQPGRDAPVGSDTDAAPAPVADTDALPLASAVLSTPVKESWVNGVRVVTRPADSASTAPATTASTATVASATAGDERSFSLNSGSVTVTTGAATATATTSAPAASGSSTVTLAGTPEQWQQPLREALGDRLQLQLQRNNEHAVIRLEPPNMGSIEISIRHSAGALQVNLSANNSEVLRQLNTIGDSVRQDLSNRQFSDVAVTVSSSRAQAQADQGQGGRNGQQRSQDDGRTPGRALNEDDSTATFAMTGE